LVRQARRELAERNQSVALLFDPRGFTYAIGQQAHQMLRQNRHSLRKFRKHRSRKTQNSSISDRPTGDGELRHSREGKHARHIARFYRKHNRLSAEFTSKLKLSFEDHEHCVSGVALAHIGFAGLDLQFLGVAQKPVELIVRQTGKRGYVEQLSFVRHYTLLRY